MRFVKLLLATLFLTDLPVFAGGQDVGNGGDAVVCYSKDGAIQSARDYDYFEAQAKWGLEPRLGKFEGDEFAKVVGFLDEFAKLMPIRAKRYQEILEFFRNDHRIAPDVKLVDVPDSDSNILPASCVIEQAAIQKEKEFPLDKYFLIAGPIWQAMPLVDRAGLILHEIIYYDLIGQGAINSRKARYIHSNIVSTAAENFTAINYLQLYRDSESDTVEIRGRAFKNNNYSYLSEDGHFGGEFFQSSREDKLIPEFRDPNSPIVELSGCRHETDAFGRTVPILHIFAPDESVVEGCFAKATAYIPSVQVTMPVSRLKRSGDWFVLEGLRDLNFVKTQTPGKITVGKYDYFLSGLKDVEDTEGIALDFLELTLSYDHQFVSYKGVGYFYDDNGKEIFFSSLDKNSKAVQLGGVTRTNYSLPSKNVIKTKQYLEYDAFIVFVKGCLIQHDPQGQMTFHNGIYCAKFLRVSEDKAYDYNHIEVVKYGEESAIHFEKVTDYSLNGPQRYKHTVLDKDGKVRCLVYPPKERFEVTFFKEEKKEITVNQISWNSDGELRKVSPFDTSLGGFEGMYLTRVDGTFTRVSTSDSLWLDSQGRLINHKPFNYSEIGSSNIASVCL